MMLSLHILAILSAAHCAQGTDSVVTDANGAAVTESTPIRVEQADDSAVDVRLLQELKDMLVDVWADEYAGVMLFQRSSAVHRVSEVALDLQKWATEALEDKWQDLTEDRLADISLMQSTLALHTQGEGSQPCSANNLPDRTIAELADNDYELSLLQMHVGTGGTIKAQNNTVATFTVVWNASNAAGTTPSRALASISHAIKARRHRHWLLDRWAFLIMNMTVAIIVVALLIMYRSPGLRRESDHLSNIGTQCECKDGVRSSIDNDSTPHWKLAGSDVAFTIPVKQLLCLSSGHSSLHIGNSADFPGMVAAISSQDGARTFLAGWEASAPAIFIGPLPAMDDTTSAHTAVIKEAPGTYFGNLMPLELSGDRGQAVCHTARGKCTIAISMAKFFNVTVKVDTSEAPVAYAVYHEATDSVQLTVFGGNEPMHLVSCVVATLLSSPTVLSAAANVSTPELRECFPERHAKRDYCQAGRL